MYAAQYERMFQMYAAGYLNATDASEVAEVVREAIESDTPRLRYQVSWGGRELVEGRARMSDEEWLALGREASLQEYIEAFDAAFGLDLRV